MYDGIIFDQDGVLLDSAINRFKWMDEIRAEEARKRGFDFQIEDAKKLVRAYSPEPVEELLNEKGMKWEHVRQIEHAKENWKIEKIEQGDIKLFEGVEPTLQSLDIPRAVVTNAPLLSTRFCLRYFGISRYFSAVNAPHTDDMRQFYSRKKPKPVMIREIMNRLELENPVMVGDSNSDIKAAENAGIDSIHLNSYGFETDSEPTHKAESIEQIVDIVS